MRSPAFPLYCSFMELLSPAGNFEKLHYAYLYGADAAYIGVKDFSLRSRADNVWGDEHAAIGKIKGQKKLYGALNIYFQEADLQRLEQALDYIARYPFDAFIVTDIGIVPVLRRRFPAMPLHLSTQANCTNSEAAKLYRDLGFSRIVLARELNLREIEKIKRDADVEIEAFVHGAMCVAYSGRCFLSRYMADRSANRGDCAHSCRWQYRVLEEGQRPGEYYPVIEGQDFTTILSSRDLCLIDHLADLRSAGVDAVKIEGRMKSIYYTAIVTRAYRKALDHLYDPAAEDPTLYRNELFKVSHREFSTGFYYGKKQVERPTLKSYQSSHEFVGVIGDSVGDGEYALDVKNRIQAGELLEYVGYDVLCIEDDGFCLFDGEGSAVSKVDHGKIAYIKTDRPVKPGYLIRRKLA